MNAVIIAADIYIAFDSIKHLMIPLALLNLGVPAGLIAALMRELRGLQADMTVAGLGTTPCFAFQRGGRQGGVETPLLFTLIMDYVMGPLVKRWDAKNYGFK
eukprot:10863289-Karenia_brevis.AAC.1